MRGKKIDLDAAAEKLELPGEALGALLITVIGKSRVLVENHRGIEQYSKEFIRLGARGGSLSIYGNGIRLRILGKNKLALEGNIRSMEWDIGGEIIYAGVASLSSRSA